MYVLRERLDSVVSVWSCCPLDPGCAEHPKRNPRSRPAVRAYRSR